jgi:hypothetical protein
MGNFRQPFQCGRFSEMDIEPFGNLLDPFGSRQNQAVRFAAFAGSVISFQGGISIFEDADIFLFGQPRLAGRPAENAGGLDTIKEFLVK